MLPAASRVVTPLLAAVLLAAARGSASPPVRARGGAPVSLDSVRQLDVAIVLLTNSFNRVLTPAEVERVHEEVAEFYAFYQQHGAGKVDFRFSLVQVRAKPNVRELGLRARTFKERTRRRFVPCLLSVSAPGFV